MLVFLMHIPVSIYASVQCILVYLFIHWTLSCKNRSLSIILLITHSFIVFYQYTIQVDFLSMNGLLVSFIFALAYLIGVVETNKYESLMLVMIPIGLPYGISHLALYLISLTKNDYYSYTFLDWFPGIILNTFLFLIVFIVSLLLVILAYYFHKNKKHKKRFETTLGFIMMAVLVIVNIFTIIQTTLQSLVILNLIFLFSIFAFYYQTNAINHQEIQELKQERNQIIYQNYKNEYDHLVNLKHDIVAKMKDLSEENYKDYLHIIDELISPMIDYYSNNQVLNMILTEKALYAKNRNIEVVFDIKDDLLFLNEEELYYLFNKVLESLLYLKNIKKVKVEVMNYLNNYTILYYFDPIKASSFFKRYVREKQFQSIEKKYRVTYVLDTDSFSINLVNPGDKDD